MADLPTNWVDNVGMVEDAAWLNLVGTNVNANTHARTLYGTFAARPAASADNNGALYFCADTDSVYRSNGSAWAKIRINGQFSANLVDPPSSGLSTVGTGTFSSDKGDRLLSQPSTSGDSFSVEYKALSPTSNYTARAYIDFTLNPKENAQRAGLALRESSSGKLISWGLTNVSGQAYRAVKFNSPTSWSADYYTLALSDNLGGFPNWLQIRDDGTNRYFEYSLNGLDWVTAFSVGRTDFMTPDQIGWGASWNGGSKPYPDKIRCRSLSVS